MWAGPPEEDQCRIPVPVPVRASTLVVSARPPALHAWFPGRRRGARTADLHSTRRRTHVQAQYYRTSWPDLPMCVVRVLGTETVDR
jgi:hypothetical protein